MPVSFVRALGHQPGVQLNPLVDASELYSSAISDQTFAIPMRATRGRIDRAMTITRADLTNRLGRAGSVRSNALNEAWVQLYEGLRISNGWAVVSRLVKLDEAVIKWAVVGTTDGAEPEDPTVYDFSVAETKAVADYLLQIKHLGCHNDGIKLSIWAEPVVNGGVDQPTKMLVLKVADAEGRGLFYFRGSTDPDAVDDYGRSLYLPDVVASRTDELEIDVGDNAAVAPVDACYGYTEGMENWQDSAVLLAFVEGADTYADTDYDDAVNRLRYATDTYAYISAGGSQTTALLAKLATLAHDTNAQLRYDIDGSLSVDAAITFSESLNFQSVQSAHLMQAFWMPVRSSDPTGLNPNGFLGAATLNIAMACARNAAVNAQGLAAKNYPIAGRRHPIPRTGLTQALGVTEGQLSNLARARINPVVFDTFSDATLCVFRDQITQAPVTNSLRMLISVVDMSTAIDEDVVRYGKDLINAYPMQMAIKRMQDFLRQRFDAATLAGWIIPSPDLDGESYQYTVAPNPDRPYDKMDVRYSLRYDGAVRQIEVTQTLSR